jgi:CheY-like chemotaxis protein
MQSALSSIHVLLVDDNPNMRAIVAAMLKSVGVGRLTEAEDGAAALNLLRQEAIDIAIVDFRMKPMDGAAFTRAVRNEGDSPNPYLPVIMMTGR